MAQIARRPALNVVDAPEVGILTGRRVASRRMAPRSRNVQAGYMALPKLPEGFAVADFDPEEASDSDIDSHSASAWACEACTLLNRSGARACAVCDKPRPNRLGHFPKDVLDSDAWTCRTCTLTNRDDACACEVCATPRPAGDIVTAVAATGRRRASVPGEAAAPGAGEAWPTLADSVESWELCDVSSLASSWLDIGDDDEIIEEDGSAILVTDTSGACRDQRPAPPSYAAMATKAGVAVSPAPRAPRLPPMAHAAHAEPRTKQKDTGAEEEDVELDELECRRIQPSTQRGATQRRRGRKR